MEDVAAGEDAINRSLKVLIHHAAPASRLGDAHLVEQVVIGDKPNRKEQSIDFIDFPGPGNDAFVLVDLGKFNRFEVAVFPDDPAHRMGEIERNVVVDEALLDVPVEAV